MRIRTSKLQCESGNYQCDLFIFFPKALTSVCGEKRLFKTMKNFLKFKTFLLTVFLLFSFFQFRRPISRDTMLLYRTSPSISRSRVTRKENMPRNWSTTRSCEAATYCSATWKHLKFKTGVALWTVRILFSHSLWHFLSYFLSLFHFLLHFLLHFLAFTRTILLAHTTNWNSLLSHTAFESALTLEKKVNESLLQLHAISSNHSDPQVSVRNPIEFRFSVTFMDCSLIGIPVRERSSICSPDYLWTVWWNKSANYPLFFFPDSAATSSRPTTWRSK